MRRAWFGPLAIAAFACGSNSATTVFSVDLRAKDGGGPLLITAIGGTLQLSAIALDAAGHQIPGVTLSWTTSDASVAAVSSGGLVTAIGNGSADITASAGVAAGRVPITVAQAPDTLAVTPASASIERGATATFSATAVDARGHVVSTAPTWKSS